MKHIWIAVVILLSGCSPATCENVDGVFVSYSEDESFRLLRFYEDSTVLMVSIGESNLDEKWPNIRKWFNRENTKPNHSVGTYVCNDGKISFSSVSLSGQVNYEGTAKHTRLILNSHSLINGHKAAGVVYKKTDLDAAVAQ